MIQAGKRNAEERLRESGGRTNHHGVGFIGIHEGKTGNFVFVDWWADENELHHHVYASGAGEPDALEYQTPRGLNACVWDLRLIGFERDAWVDAILKNHERPCLEDYLNRRLNANE